MNEFFAYDPSTVGSKGLVYVGNDILVYRRDDKTDAYPLCIDLPGGAPEADETPYDTFQREVKEEFGLDITPDDIKYVRRYPSRMRHDKATYFPVARLSGEVKDKIQLGDEGAEYFLFPIEKYLGEDNVAWPLLQERALDYIKTLN
jgi:8-oxo-dGTP diphosphatase